MTIGTPLPHDLRPSCTSRGRPAMVDDVPLPGEALCYLAFGLSDRAHAEITAIDLADVARGPGVVAVFSAADYPDSA